jgi:hypothetical protein
LRSDSEFDQRGCGFAIVRERRACFRAVFLVCLFGAVVHACLVMGTRFCVLIHRIRGDLLLLRRCCEFAREESGSVRARWGAAD